MQKFANVIVCVETSLLKARVLASIVLLLATVGPALATDISGEKSGPLVFVSENKSTFSEIISGVPAENSIQIHGHLHMPKRPPSKVPAAVILPGAGGFDEDDDRSLVKALNEIGIAVLAFDPNKARNIPQWQVAARTISDAMRVCDAYGGLKALSMHPRIDSERVAAIGRSRGGSVVLLAASEVIRRSLTNEELRFAAHIGIYPGCYAQLMEPEFTGAPVLMLLAEKDNVTPARSCLDYMERIKATGNPIRAIVYDKAAHGFTKSALHARTVEVKGLADVSRCINRHLLVQNDGSWYFPHEEKTYDSQPSFYDLNGDCAVSDRGVIGDPSKVRKKSFSDIQSFLKEVLALQ